MPVYAARKRRIKDAHEGFVYALVALHQALKARALPERTREPVLRTVAHTFDLAAVNRLIKVHNRYDPIDADLPIDPLTGVFRMREEPSQSEPSLSAAGLVAAVLAIARRARAR